MNIRLNKDGKRIINNNKITIGFIVKLLNW